MAPDTRVLITGAAGFVGSHLIDFLRAAAPDVEVHGIVRHRSDLSNLAHLPAGIVRFVDADLLDAFSLQRAVRLVRPSIVIHAAAQSYVVTSYTAPAATLQTNVVGTANLLEALRELAPEAVVLVVSSSEVYGDVEEVDLPITEATPLRPVSPYGASKAAEDLLGYVFARAYGMRTVRTRAFTHSGPRRGAVFFDSAFALQVARMEAGLQPLQLRVGNLDSVRTVMDVRDLVRGYWQLCLAVRDGRVRPGEVFNIGGRETYRVDEVVDMLRGLTSLRFDTVVDPSLLRPADVTRQVPDLTKLRATCDWTPEIPYRTTLQAMLDYWAARVGHG